MGRYIRSPGLVRKLGPRLQLDASRQMNARSTKSRQTLDWNLDINELKYKFIELMQLDAYMLPLE